MHDRSSQLADSPLQLSFALFVLSTVAPSFARSLAVLSALTAYLASTIPDPRDVYVPGAEENLKISPEEARRRLHLSPHLCGPDGAELPMEQLPESWQEVLRLDNHPAGSGDGSGASPVADKASAGIAIQ
jgi:hypothetical protein